MAIVLELTAITGNQVNRTLSISGRLAKIGTAAGSDLVLHERQIEPRHAEVHQILGRFFLVPLTPRGQGIALNGLSVDTRSRLNPGDILTLGSTSYRVAISEQAEQEVGATQPKRNVPRLGDYFIKRGYMNSDQVARTAQRQAELTRDGRETAFGQVAYELGYINRTQLTTILNDQRNDFNERFRD